MKEKEEKYTPKQNNTAADHGMGKEPVVR